MYESDNPRKPRYQQGAVRPLAKRLSFGLFSTFSFRDIGLLSEMKNFTRFSDRDPGYVSTRRVFFYPITCYYSSMLFYTGHLSCSTCAHGAW